MQKPTLTVQRPILPYKIIRILDVAMMSDILEGVEGLPPIGTPEYWTFSKGLRYLVGFENIQPEGLTDEIVSKLITATQLWRENNGSNQ